MRTIVILLACVAALKLAAEDYLYHTTTRTRVIEAYRLRAIEACRRDPHNADLGFDPAMWARPADIGLSLGKGSSAFAWLRLDSQLWRKRYQEASLLLFGPDGNRAARCEFDILRGETRVFGA